MKTLFTHRLLAGGAGRVARVVALLLAMFVCGTAYAQHTVSGVVCDDTGKPIVGVAVYVQGTTTGVTTDIDGNYRLAVPKNAVLVFSSLGYQTKEVPVGSQGIVDTRLSQENLGIDEVVVVGYGTQSRRTITSAITKVDGEVLKNIPISSIGDGLKGKIAGTRIYTNNFSPGEDPKIFIRGGSSINKSNDPLILVDGVERSMAGLNPNDISSIEVLKDAASTAIYGSRGSNGVVLITTRGGKSHQAPQITFDMSFAMQAPTTYYDVMGAEDYLRTVRPAMQFSSINSNLWADNNSASSANTSTSVYTTRYLKEGEAIPAGWKSMADPLDPSKTLIFEDNDWQKQLYNKSLWQNYYVGVTGGTDKTQYAVSAGYTTDEGVALGTGYDRFSGRINLMTEVAKRFKIRAIADYSDTQNDYFPNQKNSISRGLSAAPTMRLYFDDGTPAYGYNATSLSPLYADYITERHSRYKRLSLVGGLAYQITDHLKADVQASMFNQTRRWGAFEHANYFKQTRPASENFGETTNTKIEAYGAYSRTFNNAHSFSATAGYSYMRISKNGFGAAAEGAISDKVPTLSVSPLKTGATSSLSEEVMIGYFARLNYDFKKKYLFTATFRADGSSKFIKGHQWGYFPGASAGWVASEENFLKDNRVIDHLKFRASYGQTGNNIIDLYDALGKYGSNRYDGNAGMYPSTMPNNNLMWETTNQLDAGFDLMLCNNRISLSADYFRKVTTNLLFTKQLPNTSGFGQVEVNVGKVRFHGFDVELTTRNIVRKNFNWETKVTWSYIRNKVLELPDNGRDRNRIGGTTLADGTAFGGTAEGESLYRYYGAKISHILQTPEEAANAYYDSTSSGYDPYTGTSVRGRKFAGDYEWLNRPGSAKRTVNGQEYEMIDAQDKFLLGYTVPHSTGGMNNTFRYKGLSLNIFLDWALGHSILNTTESRMFINTFTGNTAISDKLKNSWQGVGDTGAKYAKFQTGGETQSANFRASNVFNYKADYLCIREISLSYNLPKRWISRLGMQDVSVVLAGNNLHYFTAVEGVSPEVGTSDTYNDSYSNYPPIRRLSVGLKITF